MATVTRREFWDRLELALYGSTWNTFSTQTALLIDALYDDLVARPAQAPVTRERELLRELAALVRGECPSLLNEDSGGDVRLSMAIDDALAAPPAAEELPRCDTCGRPWTKKVSAISGRIVCRACAAQAPPASDHPGPTVINEDDGDVTIDFDYAHDRVVSIRLGEESSGLSAFVDGESHALCPLDRVPPKVLALLRTSAKLVTLRQSDPPGLVALVDKHIDGLRRAYSLDGIDAAMREMGKIRIEALECFRDTLPLASPQAETKGDE